MKERTHCDPIYIRLVCFVIVPVKCLLSKSKGGTDSLGNLHVPTSSRQILVDVVHGWNNCADVG
jgi:hypothetical protein